MFPTAIRLSKDYQSKSAAAKQEELYNNVKKDKTPGTYADPLIMISWIFGHDRSYVVDRASDENIKTWPLPGRPETKRIHSVGNVATVKYESIGTHSYTGMFKGADHALVRLSLATGATQEATTPGIRVKFFRDGMKSANFVAMYTLNGQQKNQKIDGDDVGNFFANTFSNHVPPPSKNEACVDKGESSAAGSYPAAFILRYPVW